MNATRMVYLCDDNFEARESLAFKLRENMLPVVAFTSGPELLAAIDAAPKPLRGIFVLDERMPFMSGSQVHAQLLARGLEHRNPVLFLSGHGTVPVAVNAMSKGAITFIVKPFTATIVPLIRSALEQEAAWFAKAERCGELRAMWDGLSPRQREIAPLVAKGELNKVTAWNMQRSESVMEIHRKKLFANLAVKSAPELATLMAEMRACGIDLATGSGVADPDDASFDL